MYIDILPRYHIDENVYINIESGGKFTKHPNIENV